MIEPLLAGLMLALCVAGLVRLALGPARRARLDAAFSRLAQGWRRRSSRQTGGRNAPPGGQRAGHHAASKAPVAGPLGVWRRLRQRAAQREAERRAAREAEALIRRARDGHWDGNVYRPKAFDGVDRRKRETPPGRGPRDTLH